MNEYTATLLAKISMFATLLPASIALYNRRHADWSQRMIFKLVLLALATELLAYLTVFIADYLGIAIRNNLFLVHISTVISFILISQIYRRELTTLVARKNFNLLIIGFTVYAVLNSIFVEPITQFNDIARTVSGLFIISFTLLYFYKLLQELKVQRLEKEPMFWLSTGLLLYFSASLFIFLFGNYIRPSVKLSFTFWGIHAIVNILLCVFYAIALWIKPLKTV